LTEPPRDALSPSGALLENSSPLQEKALRCLGSLPPFSPILNKLMASLASDDVSFSKLADLIEKDTVVAGNVLHLVNSALYARRGTINSVRHALSLLGVNKLRNAVLGMSISRMWNQVKTPPSWSMARFNMHSAATAILSDMLAQRIDTPYPEGAFVAGLLHDVGRLLIAVGLSQEHEQILQLMTAHPERSLLECEQEVLGFTHPQLSASALRHWNLPDPIREAVAEHHTLPASPVSKSCSLGAIVAAADLYVTSIGVTILTPPRQPGTPAISILGALGLDPARLEVLVQDFQSEFDNISPFFR
jgi:HD-like signal output (HDOD) protein